ncbi:MAG TPA: VOC family protein [Streptosporangiaceae bacterium]
MALAQFKDLCLDAGDTARIGRFWGRVLGLEYHPQDGGDAWLSGRTPQHVIWVNRVPEAKKVKQRVHFDIYAKRLADLEALGSVVLEPEGDGRRWTVMADPEGGEYCAFLRPEPPAGRLHGLVVDSADPAAQAQWWAGVYGVPVEYNPGGWSTVRDVPGMPILTMDFDPVPEPKTAKNRVHWDVTVPDLDALIKHGATVLAPPAGDAYWHVMADPEGNEFCAFAP